CQKGSQFVVMKRNMPELLAKASTAFHCKDWLYFKLTGDRATDPSEATFTFGDFRTREYCDDVLDVLGVADLRHLLPPIVDGSRQSAGLSRAAAEATGLSAGTPVVLAYVDVVCTALGAGLFDRQRKPGCSIIGSTGMHMRLAETPDDVLLNEAATGYTMT
ncbi:carbohydrate kinase, partial [Mesorhizobium sp. M00.F.Ca.ET.149.01.1.1]